MTDEDAHVIVRKGDDGVLRVGADRPGVAATTAPVEDVRALISQIASEAGIAIAFIDDEG